MTQHIALKSLSDKALAAVYTSLIISITHDLVSASDYTSCNTDQATNCKNAALGGSMASLAQGGQCEAKSYVEFTHTCTITAHYQPDMDYCCCALQQRVMCCRYYQSGNLFRCVETDDTVTTLSQVSVPLELLLPAILVPLLLLVCCVACCVRCCMRYREDSDTFCRCTAGDDDDCALTKQTPMYVSVNGGAGPEAHSLLLGRPSPANHRSSCQHSSSPHVTNRHWSTGSLRYKDSPCATSCHQTPACPSCHCTTATHDIVPTATPCPRHRQKPIGCCHEGVAICRQWSAPGGGCSCVASSAFTCQSSDGHDQGQGHCTSQCQPSSPHSLSPAADSCVKLSPPHLHPTASTVLIIPSAPPALGQVPEDGFYHTTCPPSYDESMRMDTAKLSLT